MNKQIDNLTDNHRILIVDDQITILKSLSKFMGIHGIQVEIATNAKNTLQMLESGNKFDLVILDVLMPEMDGFELCRRIREMFSMYELPVVFITAKNNMEDIVKGFDAGANDYILKPFDFYELLARSRNLIKLKKLAERNAQLNSVIDFKNKFHQMTVHDLKNPLSSIILLSDLMAMDATDEQQTEYLRTIHRSSSKMLDLINSFLDLHKLEAGKITLSKENSNIIEIIKSTVDANNNNATNKRQTLSFTHNCAENAIFNLDKMRIEQVIDNLISNAIKYSGYDAEINLTLNYSTDKYNNKFLKFSISDQGPGFTAEDQEVIFTQFADLSAKPTGGEGSTGIGLSIAKAIISLHNGKIWAENNQNIGSTIHFTIPV